MNTIPDEPTQEERNYILYKLDKRIKELDESEQATKEKLNINKSIHHFSGSNISAPENSHPDYFMRWIKVLDRMFLQYKITGAENQWISVPFHKE